MGSNCSCLHGGNIDEKQISTDKNAVEIDKNMFKSLESTYKINTVDAKDFSVDLRVDLLDIISLQAILRGYLDRKKVNTVHLQNHGKSKRQGSEFLEKGRSIGNNSHASSNVPPRRSTLQEIPSNKVPDYSNAAIKMIQTKLGPFIYRDMSIENLFKKGPVLMENQAVYIGEWNKDNLRHGRGSQNWNDGSLYEGYWENDKASGKGRLIHANGDVYEGEWKNDRANGIGIYIHNDGAKYEGAWENDKQHGLGKEVWPDGARYEGAYENGLKHGFGKFEWADGSVYEGNFMFNNIHGSGTYTWSDGRKFIGQWRDNKMHGTGVFTWSDGRKYEGDYFNDKKHGFGIFIWADGRRYEGEWKNGKQHGRGKYTNSNGICKESEWQDGKRIQTASTLQN